MGILSRVFRWGLFGSGRMGCKDFAGRSGLDTIQLRVGAGRFDSVARDSAARDSRVVSSPTTRRGTAAAAGRRHPTGLLHSSFRSRFTPPSPFPICSSSPLSSPHFSHRLNPFIFLLDLGGSSRLLGAAAAGAASSRRSPFSSAVPAGHTHLRPPLPSTLWSHAALIILLGKCIMFVSLFLIMIWFVLEELSVLD